MLDTDKVSLALAADYVGLSTDALKAMEAAGWIKRVANACSIPVYLGADIKRLKLAVPPETPEQIVQRDIREKCEYLMELIGQHTAGITSLQGRCTHPSAKKESKSDTGNWDQSQDSYWKDCKCPDCGKRWTEDQRAR